MSNRLESFDREVVLCATARLARTLPLEMAARAGAEVSSFAVPRTATLTQWLTAVTEEALLSGELDPAQLPERVLSAQAERLLWERVLRESLGADAAGELFDVAGLAAEAMHATELLSDWSLQIDLEDCAEESRRLLAWREAFMQCCQREGWASAAMLRSQQVTWIETGGGRLPPSVALIGFDRYNPLEKRLLAALQSRGVSLREWPTGHDCEGTVERFGLTDGEQECRAAVAWAVTLAAQHPGWRIGIAVPDLAQRRHALTRLLDHALDTASVHPAHAQIPRSYNISLGVRLSDVPLASLALGLLRLLSQHEFAQRDLSHLLTRSAWGGGEAEANDLACLDARMRARLPPRTRLDRVIKLARKAIVDGLQVKTTCDRLEQARRVIEKLPTRAPASAWGRHFGKILQALGWPGESALSSHDFQAREAFASCLDALAGLDGIAGERSLSEALADLNEACAAHLFQPRTEGRPPIQVLGLLEAAGERFDALWVMGMNDDLWPPPPAPSPLLPARLQRQHRLPNASAEIQLDFAGDIHQRLLKSAAQIIFSHALREGEAERRLSPLVLNLPAASGEPALALTLGERLRLVTPPDATETIDDHLAPAVPEGEKLSGGTSLFRTQAICPAWAFYAHRLGAQALETPVEGLDARDRGSLVHAVLERFWSGHDSEWLESLSSPALQQAIQQAVDTAMQDFLADREATLPERFLALERARLIDLLGEWVELERKRGTGFVVRACEQSQIVEVGAISVKLIIDRIDTLDDGNTLFIDYKTGATVDTKSWAEARITEPQLPIYASFAGVAEPVAGIALGSVRLGKSRFAGITADDGILPAVKGLEKSRKAFNAETFPDWSAVLGHWRSSLLAISDEIRSGEAAVRFTSEADLQWCELAPVLRLAERAMLYERLGSE